MVRPRAIVFDIGGVLEITPRLGVLQRWEARLGLPAGEVRSRLVSLFRAGEIGAVTEEAVHAGVGAALGLDEGKVNAFMDDIWTEYLGTPNVELIRYFRSLRPRYRTALLSNSFVGARRKEQERYGFEEMAGRLASLASGPSVMLEARCDTTRSVSQVLVPFSDLQTLIGGRLSRWRS